MGHQLWPPKGTPFLEPEEVVERLRREFPAASADREAGAASLDEGIGYMRGWTGVPAAAAMIAKAERDRGRAWEMVLADTTRPGQVYLTTLVRPEDGLLFGYTGARHERAAAPLVGRAARALGYEVHLI